ncbi:DNA ligase [compost metagenome]
MNKIQQAFEVLTLLELTGSKNEKIALLTAAKENDTLQWIFFYAYNPFMKYNIVKYPVPELKGTGEPKLETFAKFLNLLDHLSERAITGNEAINTVTSFFETLTPDEYKWYSRTLLKDLKVGATESTANKVWKGFIPVFDCMLAKPWEDVKKKPETVYINPKLDGYRAVNLVSKDALVEMFTRNGKPILGFDDILKDLSQLPGDRMYDAEIIGKDSAFNDMQKLMFKKGVGQKQGTLMIFDSITLDEFSAGVSETPIAERITFLEQVLGKPDEPKYENLRMVPFFGPIPYNDPRVDELYSLFTMQGYEGIMVKDASSLYVCKRSPAWAKIKPTETYDLEIIGYEEGEGKHSGKLGSFIVSYYGNRVNVGSGFNDNQRVDYWLIRNQLVGKVIEIEAQEATENQKGGRSLRFPIFKKIRLDK